MHNLLGPQNFPIHVVFVRGHCPLFFCSWNPIFAPSFQNHFDIVGDIVTSPNVFFGVTTSVPNSWLSNSELWLMKSLADQIPFWLVKFQLVPSKVPFFWHFWLGFLWVKSPNVGLDPHFFPCPFPEQFGWNSQLPQAKPLSWMPLGLDISDAWWITVFLKAYYKKTVFFWCFFLSKLDCLRRMWWGTGMHQPNFEG